METRIREALKQVKYPGFSRDIVAFGLVKSVGFESGTARIGLSMSVKDTDVPQKIEAQVRETIGALEGVQAVEVDMKVTTPVHEGPKAPEPLPGVQNIIAVASGKGGVGKSTVSVQLACALEHQLSQAGRPGRVGIMDCDIYGPSVPLMMGLSQQPDVQGDQLVPVENFGVRVMSMGLLVDEHTPVIWRGPMVMKAIQQFTRQVAWGELDYLIIDLPPGTGDAQLSLVQSLPLSGAIVVTTPQKVAVQVALRGATLFHKVNVRILGVVESMGPLVQPDGTTLDIFGSGGGAQTAQALEVPLLGSVPTDPKLRAGGDFGIPLIVDQPTSPTSQAFFSIAQCVQDSLQPALV